jgi:hypothetical protein
MTKLKWVPWAAELATSCAPTQGPLAVISLVVANLVPAFGVVFLGWDALGLVLLYWMENIVTGFFTVWKMSLSRVGRGHERTRRFFIVFFMVHYGGFCAGHLVLACAALGHAAFGEGVFSVLPQYLTFGMFASLGMLLFEHGRSFYVGYVRPRKHLSTDVGSLMFTPYPRIVILHLVVIVGGIMADKYRHAGPQLAVLLLIPLKTVMELILFRFRSGNQPAPRHVVRTGILTFCALLCAVGIGVAWTQHRRVTGYLPVQATVLRAEIVTTQIRQDRDEEGRVWTLTESIPRIQYEYSVAGRTFTNETIFSMPYFLVVPGAGSVPSAQWAIKTACGPPAGAGNEVVTNAATQAFYNRGNPSEAFLIKRCTKLPFHLILIPTGLTLLTLFGRVFTSPFARQILAGTWHVIGIGGILYLWRFHAFFDANPVALLIVYELVGLIPLSLVVFKRFASAVSEVHFSVG